MCDRKCGIAGNRIPVSRFRLAALSDRSQGSAEVVVGLRKVRLEADGSTLFRLRLGVPLLATQGDAEGSMCLGVIGPRAGDGAQHGLCLTVLPLAVQGAAE